MLCWRPKRTTQCAKRPSFIWHKIRAMVQDLAQQANLQDPQKFAQIWHMLMKGSIVSACEGNRNAAREAKQAARIIIHNWQSQ